MKGRREMLPAGKSIENEGKSRQRSGDEAVLNMYSAWSGAVISLA